MLRLCCSIPTRGAAATLFVRQRFSVSKRFSSTFQYDLEQLAAESKEPLVPHLKKRGLIESITNNDLEKLSDTQTLSLYCGADPTAKSLHLGNLLPLLIMMHYNIRGHNIVGLVGGATGKVGDPSGRLTERSQMNTDVQQDNTERIKKQLHEFLNSSRKYITSIGFPVPQTENSGDITIANNYDWWKNVKLLDFLATYGKFIRVNAMLARDSVKGRLASQAGIGFNEFTYQILQAYDFWYLFRNHGVTVQIGGNDQWGNITAGIDFITRMKNATLEAIKSLPKDEQKKEQALVKLFKKPAFGLTVPLLTTASGQKFGKSAGNAVFIDSDVTPAFEMYNFFMKTQDSEVEKLLKIFTVIPLQQIEAVIKEHQADPSARNAQRILADQVTSLLHGKESTYSASVISSILYPLPEEPYPTNIATYEILQIFDNAGLLKKVSREEIAGQKLSTVLSKVANCSKTEARNTVKSGGLYIGYDRTKVDSRDFLTLTGDLLIDEKFLLLRVGKAKYYTVEVTN